MFVDYHYLAERRRGGLRALQPHVSPGGAIHGGVPQSQLPRAERIPDGAVRVPRLKEQRQ
eukprot:1195939-Prorocentrum_minimum.AAC.3